MNSWKFITFIEPHCVYPCMYVYNVCEPFSRGHRAANGCGKSFYGSLGRGLSIENPSRAVGLVRGCSKPWNVSCDILHAYIRIYLELKRREKTNSQVFLHKISKKIKDLPRSMQKRGYAGRVGRCAVILCKKAALYSCIDSALLLRNGSFFECGTQNTL